MSGKNMLKTTDIILPDELADDIFIKPEKGSILGTLSGAKAQKFGESTIMTLESRPRAELVGEGEKKSPTGAKFGKRKVLPRKLQVTMRFSDEVMWADEDHQLDVLSTLADAGGKALSRALDLIAFHGINPLTGSRAPSITEYLGMVSNAAIAGGKPDIDVESAAGLVIAEGWMPTGIALDSSFAWKLATARFDDGRKKFPELGLGLDVSRFEGLPSSVSNTVSGRPEIAQDTGILGIIGDWTTALWGVQRKVGVKLIEYGDPDGQGDLQRENEVAMRAEIVYGVGFIDLNAFALIKED